MKNYAIEVNFFVSNINNTFALYSNSGCFIRMLFRPIGSRISNQPLYQKTNDSVQYRTYDRICFLYGAYVNGCMDYRLFRPLMVE